MEKGAGQTTSARVEVKILSVPLQLRYKFVDTAKWTKFKHHVAQSIIQQVNIRSFGINLTEHGSYRRTKEL